MTGRMQSSFRIFPESCLGSTGCSRSLIVRPRKLKLKLAWLQQLAASHATSEPNSDLDGAMEQTPSAALEPLEPLPSWLDPEFHRSIKLSERPAGRAERRFLCSRTWA